MLGININSSKDHVKLTLMLPILFEDDSILAILKPSGLPSQSIEKLSLENNAPAPTAESLVQAAYPGSKLLLLHRLDTGTSGVLLFAKSESIFNQMRLKFAQKTIRKFYRAFCKKSEIPLPKKIEIPLAHHPKSKKRMIPLPPGKKRDYRGKPLKAETLILNATESTFENTPCLEVEIEITTGVMHQIRVHLAYCGAPLLGDALYNKDYGLTQSPSRLALFAEKVEFELNGKLYFILAPPLKS